MKGKKPNWAGICVVSTILWAGWLQQAAAHEGWTEKDCDKTRQKIKKIESKMRQGYSASQGIKMEDELRRLRRLRSKQCR